MMCRWQTALRPLTRLTLSMDLLFRSNLQMGSYQPGCMAPTADEPCQWLMPGEMLSTDTLATLIPQPCYLFWDRACCSFCRILLLFAGSFCSFCPILGDIPQQRVPGCLGLFGLMKESVLLFSEPEGGRRKDKQDSIWVSCSCAAEFKRNPQALSAEWQTCASAAAQDPCLIISYLNKFSGIRVWMLARQLGKDLGCISSADSQGEKACGLLCGRAAGYKERLWL